MKRYGYLRQFAPTLLEHLPVDLEPTGSPALLDALDILRDLNTTGRRTLPEELPIACLPKRLRPFVETNGTPQRRAYECAVLTTLRDEIKRGNVWIRGSTRFGKLDDFFLPDATWTARRQEFFRKAGLPAEPAAVAPWLTTRLNAAYDRFLAALPTNTSVTFDKEGWHLATDPAEALTPADEAGVAALRTWLHTRSCIRPLRIIHSTAKPATMSPLHHPLRGHCHGTNPLCLPTQSRGAGVRLPDALLAVAQRRRFPSPADRANHAIPTQALQGTQAVCWPASATAVRPV